MRLDKRVEELGIRSLKGLMTHDLEHPVRHLLELCGGGMLSGLIGALSAGHVIYKYSYVDISNNARRIALHRLQQLLEQYP